jgi:hypothetical protein
LLTPPLARTEADDDPGSFTFTLPTIPATRNARITFTVVSATNDGTSYTMPSTCSLSVQPSRDILVDLCPVSPVVSNSFGVTLTFHPSLSVQFTNGGGAWLDLVASIATTPSMTPSIATSVTRRFTASTTTAPLWNVTFSTVARNTTVTISYSRNTNKPSQLNSYDPPPTCVFRIVPQHQVKPLPSCPGRFTAGDEASYFASTTPLQTAPQMLVHVQTIIAQDPTAYMPDGYWTFVVSEREYTTSWHSGRWRAEPRSP